MEDIYSIKYGPYLRKDRRKQVDVLDSDGRVISMLYSRYLISIELGRVLTPEEHVDHINGDALDDSISNLQVLTQSQNSKKDAIHKADDGTYYKPSGKELSDKQKLWVSGCMVWGDKNGNWKSYIITPYGRFSSLRDAANADTVNHAAIDKRIKSPNFPEYYREV